VEKQVTEPHDSNDAALPDMALSKLMLASIMMADDMERGLAERGLTRVRATVLWEILHREPITQRELADALKVTPRNVTTLVDAMEATGFVKRTDHPSDRRAILVALTPKGRKAASRMKVETQALAKALFGDLGASELRRFVGNLDRVVGRLDQLISSQTNQRKAGSAS
jgi:DNA-binding MarR family transcriptional regulator